MLAGTSGSACPPPSPLTTTFPTHKAHPAAAPPPPPPHTSPHTPHTPSPQAGLRSFFMVPIGTAQEVFGTLTVAHKDVDAFDEQWWVA